MVHLIGLQYPTDQINDGISLRIDHNIGFDWAFTDRKLVHHVREGFLGWTAAILSSITLGVGLLAAVFTGARRGWSRKSLVALFALAFGFLLAPGIAWSWSNPLSNQTRLTYSEQFLFQTYNGKYGGLTIPHRFGPTKSKLNPPDILEAGGYIREVQVSPDGTNVVSFALYTLHGQRLEFLVRPDIVPINEDLWNVERFRAYSRCVCLVAIHFTQQSIGKVPIILFAVEDESTE